MLVSSIHNDLFRKKCHVPLERVSRKKVASYPVAGTGNGAGSAGPIKVPKLLPQDHEVSHSGDQEPTDLSLPSPRIKSEEIVDVKTIKEEEEDENGETMTSDKPQDLSKPPPPAPAPPEEKARTVNRPKPSQRKKKRVKGQKRAIGGSGSSPISGPGSLPSVVGTPLDPNYPFNTASRISQELPGCNWLEEKIKMSRYLFLAALFFRRI